MRFTVDSSALNKALKAVSPAIQQNVVIPVLENVLVDVQKTSCTITATNLNITIKNTINCESSHSFKMLLPFKETMNITSVIATQPITIEDKENKILIGNKHSVGKVGEVKHFPTTEIFEPSAEFEADEDFMYHLQLATNCISKNDIDVQFVNVCLEFKDGLIQILSSDKMQIFRYEQPSKIKSNQICIDGSFVKAFKVIPSGKLSVNEKFFKIENDTTAIIGILSEQRFPDCSIFFTPYEHNCIVSRGAILQSINEIMVFNALLFDVSILFVEGGIKLKFDDNNNDFHYETSGVIEAEHSVEIEKIRVNGAMLKNLLSLTPEYDTINMSIKDYNKLVHIDTENENLKLIISPLFNN